MTDTQGTLEERLRAPLPEGMCGQSMGCNAASFCLCSHIEDQRELLTEAADEIASLRARVEGLVAENESLRHECTSMWRGGVSNTVAVVDRVRNAFAKGLRLKKNARLAHFDAELDIALGDWFDLTRIAKPGTYNESENVFRRARQALKDSDNAE